VKDRCCEFNRVDIDTGNIYEAIKKPLFEVRHGINQDLFAYIPSRSFAFPS
jgi:hypothetical protein